MSRWMIRSCPREYPSCFSISRVQKFQNFLTPELWEFKT